MNCKVLVNVVKTETLLLAVVFRVIVASRLLLLAANVPQIESNDELLGAATEKSSIVQ